MSTLCMPAWICTLCGYSYGEADGEKQIAFQSLDDNWDCPNCRASKEMFSLCRCVRVADWNDAATFGFAGLKSYWHQKVRDFIGLINIGRRKASSCV